MKKLISYFLILFCKILTAQTVTFEYSYDAVGNRIKREVILIEENEETPAVAQKNSVFEPITIEEKRMALLVDVYPNPATSYLNIKVSEIKDAKFLLFNTSGQNIDSGEISNHEHQIQLHNLPPGIYYLKIENKTSVKEFKIIKN